MATAGEPSPSNFDFTLDVADQLPYYDPDRIAEQAVWPTVDAIWGGDWRDEAEAGHEFKYPSSGGGHDGRWLRVSLQAYCHLVERKPEGEPDVTEGLVIIEIEEKPSRKLQEIIIHHARQMIPETIDSFKEEALHAKKGILYSFDMGGDAEVNAYQAIEDQEGNQIWSSDDYEDFSEDGFGSEEDIEADEDEYGVVADVDRFHLQDIENLTIALSILGAPEDCLRNMSIIKGQPVKAEVIESDERD